MKLKSISYKDIEQPTEWTIEHLLLGNINLLVGKNASGKSRTINIINALSQLVSGRAKPIYRHCKWNAEFEHNEQPISYFLEVKDSQIIREIFSIDGEAKLDRSEGGKGRIYAEKQKDYLSFQTPETDLAVVSRRDEIQHSFLQPLYDWGALLRYYPFGTSLGKESYAHFTKAVPHIADPADHQQVVGIYQIGEQQIGEPFKNAIKTDMAYIGYELEDISLGVAPLIVTVPIPVELVGLRLKEKRLSGYTDQLFMSQGMFRALSIVIQINYSTLTKVPSCILIDDIGEGLDFERSCALIELLMRKAEEAQVQLIMSTNDRFVMNKVPIEAWSVLQLHGNHCDVYNYQNSKDIFEEFKYTGLNNFDFFSTDFIHAEKDEELAAHGTS